MSSAEPSTHRTSTLPGPPNREGALGHSLPRRESWVGQADGELHAGRPGVASDERYVVHGHGRRRVIVGDRAGDRRVVGGSRAPIARSLSPLSRQGADVGQGRLRSMTRAERLIIHRCSAMAPPARTTMASGIHGLTLSLPVSTRATVATAMATIVAITTTTLLRRWSWMDSTIVSTTGSSIPLPRSIER